MFSTDLSVAIAEDVEVLHYLAEIRQGWEGKKLTLIVLGSML